MNLTAEQMRSMQIFFPYASQKYLAISANSGRLVHYTTAEAAVSMVRNKEVWMRNATAVNDFMEIEHGLGCLSDAYKSDAGDRFRKALDRMYPGIVSELEKRINGWIPDFKTGTYITCVSEHLPKEDRIGRLSMWRAYGGTTGVAIVLNVAPFLSTSNALRVYSSPVAYFDGDTFLKNFEKIVSSVESNSDFISTLGHDTVFTSVFNMMRFAALCTKHPGFEEEREWRVIYSPKIDSSQRVTSEIKVIRGAPQRVFKIPLKDFPNEGFTGAEIPQFVERVIIGPSQYPFAIRDAVIGLLEEAGVENASAKVWASDIPLRQ